MDRLFAMRIFVRVVDTGSFTRTALDLQVPTATVSRLVQSLETHLGAKLLNRTTRAVRLTELGTGYYERCLQVLGDIEEMEAAVGDSKVTARGRLRISLPATVAKNVLIPALPSFIEENPDIKVDLLLSDRPVDLVEQGIDCAIRVGDISEAGIIAKRVGDVRRVICAAPSYLEAHGEPKVLADLANHVGVGYMQHRTGRAIPWEFTVGTAPQLVHMRTVVTVDDADSYVSCGVAGLGIVSGSEFSLGDYVKSGKLKQILTRCQPTSRPISLLYLRDRHMPRKIRVFIEWFAAVYAKATDL